MDTTRGHQEKNFLAVSTQWRVREIVRQCLRAVIRVLLALLYQVKVKGLEHYHQAGTRVLIIANHTSFLDAVLLAVFLPERVTFTVDTQMAHLWWVRIGLALVDFFPLDPSNPLAVKALIQYLSTNAARWCCRSTSQAPSTRRFLIYAGGCGCAGSLPLP